MNSSNTTTSQLMPSAHISLPTIQGNFESLRSFAAGAETSAVVKANCYGHGMMQIAPALAEVGCKTFFTAYLNEAVELRTLLGATPAIFVLNGIQPAELATYKALDIRPVCNSIAQVSLWLTDGNKLPYAIHFDSGMNRLGVPVERAEDVRSQTSDHSPELIMSHLACADINGHPMNAAQLERFSSVRELFENSRASLSNTAGIYLGPNYHFDLVRPGIGLYGGGPARPPEIRLKTALTLTAPILSVFEAVPGETVGYGATYDIKSPSLLATVALGYADGFLRSASNYGFGVLDGMPCPIVGRVSMDLITIDVTDVATAPKTGDRVEFIGPKAGYEIQAEAMGTIGYELTSRLGQRISRSWGE